MPELKKSPPIRKAFNLCKIYSSVTTISSMQKSYDVISPLSIADVSGLNCIFKSSASKVGV